MKKITLLLLLSLLVYTGLFAQSLYIAHPYYGDNAVRFYDKGTSTLHHTLSLAPDGITGPNCVRIFNDKIFISTDAGGSSKVAIYNYSDVYPVRTANPPQILNFNAGVAGIEVDAAGDLYVSKFNGGGQAGQIIKFTAASNYATSSTMPLYDNDWWINYYAGVTVDAEGNIWALNLDEHELICFTAASSYNSYYVVSNNGDIYPSTSLTGGTNPTVSLFSAPEGIQFDASGNLWIANNNDWTRTNNAGEGTFVKIDAAYITWLLGQPVNGSGAGGQTSSNVVPLANATVYHLSGAKFGGIRFDGNYLYLNDQGTNQGNTWDMNGEIWKWNTTTAFNAVNITTTGIHTTYPGYGGIDFNNMAFPLPVELASFEAKVVGKRNIALAWTSAQEVNSDYYEVERSKNGVRFESIGKVRAAGNSHSLQRYSFVDETPNEGINYYRLKQVDSDNNFTYSKIIYQQIGTKRTYIQYHQSQLSSTGGLSISLFDVAGTLLKQGQTISTADLPSGIYIAKTSEEALKIIK